MGNPKQKWTSEEESSLKAGISKHGAGKWSAILKDPEFSQTLFSRSNVDLKDKWRNLRLIPTGRGCRGKVAIALNKSQQIPKHHNNQTALSNVVEDFSDEIVDAKPLAMSTEFLQTTTPKRLEAKLDTQILEAIINFKEPTGSNKTTISMYIEDHHKPPPDFKLELSGKLKEMTETGKLIKVKHNYRIAPSSYFKEGRSSKVLLTEVGQQEPFRVDGGDFNHLNKPQIDADLARMEFMTSQEAAEAAAQAVVEAEVAMFEAEESVQKAEAAEADAESAEAFAEAAEALLKDKIAAMMVFEYLKRTTNC